MKYLKFVILFALMVSCKKQKESPDSLTGTWELRHVIGVQISNAPSTFPVGNGHTIAFYANKYQTHGDGKIMEGTYALVKESAEIDGNKYVDKIIFDEKDQKMHIKLSGKTLSICSGSIALDGSTTTYEKL